MYANNDYNFILQFIISSKHFFFRRFTLKTIKHVLLINNITRILILNIAILLIK